MLSHYSISSDMDDLATHPMELDSIDLELDSIDLEILSPTMKVIRHCSHLPFGLTAPSLHSGLVDEDLSLFTASSHCGLVEGPFQLMLFLTVHRMVLDGFFLSTAETDRDYAIGYKTMFSDQHPFLLISQESLDALNQKLKEPMHINRFRPNILVEGGGPFCEDLWKEIKINKFTFYCVKLCARCKVPTISQETGIADSNEPTETMKQFRSDKILLPNKKPQGQVFIGQHLVCKECFTVEAAS